MLDRLHAELPGTPLLVAEYGIGTDDDDERATYLARGLEIVHDALARGIDVRGLLPLDRRRQLRVAARLRRPFGIIDRDRNVKTSAAVLKRQTGH